MCRVPDQELDRRAHPDEPWQGLPMWIGAQIQIGPAMPASHDPQLDGLYCCTLVLYLRSYVLNVCAEHLCCILIELCRTGHAL